MTLDKRMFVLNTVITIVDTLVASLAIVAFAWGSWNFGKWWILLFNLIPLVLFNSHTLVLNTTEKEGDEDAAGTSD